MDFDELKNKISAAARKNREAAETLGTDKLALREKELAEIQADPDLYKDVARAREVNTEAKYVTETLKAIASASVKAKELTELLEMCETENDPELAADLEKEVHEYADKADAFYLTTLLSGEYDHGDCILSLHAGAGGTEAQDWVQMLYRMYTMYCDKHGFSHEEIDILPGDDAGIKSVTFNVHGINAYGYLKCEKGVHRLVRISPFDSNARRHTSFASLEVMPEIHNDAAIVIRPEDIRVDTYRSSGAGGQHINKTDSAIRITHLKTNIVVSCQTQRSQVQNRETAMMMLRGKLIELAEREAMEKAAAIKGEVKKIEWGSQIRSYVFQPYTLVKDHRTGYENPDVAAVMNGNIDEFIFDYLKKINGSANE